MESIEYEESIDPYALGLILRCPGETMHLSAGFAGGHLSVARIRRNACCATVRWSEFPPMDRVQAASPQRTGNSHPIGF